MNVTGCVPLAGQGLVARRGSLVALTDGMDAAPDPLLAALTAVADANGDGAALVLAGTRAALERGGRPAWACAGVTFGGEVAILVHGAAAALVSVDGSPEAEVTASGSMIPVVRTFVGAVVTVRLVIGAPAAPDPRLWLDAGTVSGGGIQLTVKETSRSLLPNDPQVPAVSTAPPAAEQFAESPVSRPPGPARAGSVPAVSAPAAVAPGAVPPEEPGAVPPQEAAYPRGHEPTMLAGTPAGQAGARAGEPAGGPAAYPETTFAEVASFPDESLADPAGPAGHTQTGPDTESWFRTQAQPAGPALRMTRLDSAGADGLSEPPIADISAMEVVRLGAVEPVVVDGAMCTQTHFNAPDAVVCRECGISMREVTPNMLRLPRPPLGVLLVDDGRGYTLDRDYVIGREPVLDGDVAAGRATPLPISDPESSVSRLHLRVSLVGWQVEVRDLGSSNGSVLYRAGVPRALAPMDTAVLYPGARVGVGRRTVQFLPYSAFPFGVTLDGATS